MPSQVKKPYSHGFTLVEIMTVIIISSLLVGVIISFMISVTGQFAVSTVRGQMNTQMTSATNRLQNDIQYSRFVLAENSVSDSAAPTDNNRWNSNDTQLVLGVTARNSSDEPLGDTYIDQLDNYVYYLKDDTLYRRLLAHPNSNNRHTTATCAQTTTGGCSSDTVILRNIESLQFTYYSKDSIETSSYDLVASVKMNATIKTSQSRHEVKLKSSNTFRLASYFSQGNSSPEVEPEPVPTSLNCFLIDNGGTRVRDYYDHEHNNSSNPVCPRNVVIPPEITNFYNGAMSNKNLTSVAFLTAGQSISVRSNAFRNNNLTSLTIPVSVDDIGSNAFANNQLTSLTFPPRSTPLSTGNGAFSDNNITSLSLPDTGQPIRIGSNTFRNNNLTSLTIPVSVDDIGSNAFANNQLTSLTFPPRSTPLSTGNGAFSDNNITSLSLPDTGQPIRIGSNTFRNNNITSLTVPAVVNSIGSYAFANNTSIVIVWIPNSTSVSSSAFPASTTIIRY